MSLTRIWIRWWRINRMIRAGGFAIALFAATGWMWWARNNPPDERLRTTATVTRLIESTLNDNGHRLVTVALKDGRTGRLMVPPFAALEGTEIPVYVEVYENRDDFIAFDMERYVDSAAPSPAAR